MNKFTKVLLLICVIILVIGILFVNSPAGMDYLDIQTAYDNLGISKSESSRFMYNSYEELEEAVADGSLQAIINGTSSGQNSIMANNPNANSATLVECAKVVCSQFTLNGKFHYSQSGGSAGEISFNNSNIIYV